MQNTALIMNGLQSVLGISYEEKEKEKRDEICKRNKARLLITVIKTQLVEEKKTEYIVVYFSSQN